MHHWQSQKSWCSNSSRNTAITNRQGREFTGIKSENQMKNVFYTLRDARKIVMLPKGNKTEWTLA